MRRKNNIIKYSMLVFLGILIMGCVNKSLAQSQKISLPICLEGYDTIPISRILDARSYFWKIDSFGNNGYRKEMYRYFTYTKNYDVDYDFVQKGLGKGIESSHFTSDGNQLYLVYYTFNTNKMDKTWTGYNIEDKLVFTFDPKTKKLIGVMLSTSN